MATREDVQPYFRAFMIERGYHDTAETNPVEYMEWIQTRWRELGELLGFAEPQRKLFRDRFAAWLEERVTKAEGA